MTHCSWKLVAISKRIVRSGPDRFGDRLAAARCHLGQCPGELRQLGVALDAADLPRGGKHAGRCPAQPHVPVLPALHVAGVVAHDLDHGLDRVGRGDGAQQCAGHAQAGYGEHLGQALAEAAGGVRVELLQLTGECLEVPVASSASGFAQARRSLPRTHPCSRSGRWSRTRSWWWIRQRWTSACSPKTSCTARRSALPPSSTNRIPPVRHSLRGSLAHLGPDPSWEDFEAASEVAIRDHEARYGPGGRWAVSYTHLRAHE